MSWKPITLTIPAEVLTLSQAMSGYATAADSALAIAETASALLENSYVPIPDPASAVAAAALIQVQGLLENLEAVAGYSMALHPYQPTVGVGQGLMKSLSFPQILDRFSSEILNQGDVGRPAFDSGTSVEMITIVVGHASPALLLALLEIFTDFLNIKEFKLAARRIAQALDLEKTKKNRFKGSGYPDWDSTSLTDMDFIKSFTSLLKEQVGTLEAYSQSESKAFSELSGIISKKRTKVAKLKDQLDSLVASLSSTASDGIKAIYLQEQGSVALANAMTTQVGQPGAEVGFCAGFSIVAPAPGLTFIKEMLGL